MKYPIEMKSMVATVGTYAVRDIDFVTKAEKSTADGQPLFAITLAVMDGNDLGKLKVKVVGDPGLSLGQVVLAQGLAINVIDKDGTIMWWTVENLVPLGPPPSLDGDAPAGRSGKAAA